MKTTTSGSKILVVLNEGGVMDTMTSGNPPFEEYALIDCQNGAAGDTFTFTEDWRPLLNQFFAEGMPPFVKIVPAPKLSPEEEKKALQDRIATLKAQVEAGIAELRKISEDPVSIKMAGTPVDIEIHPEGDDQRVTVGHKTMGCSVVNYTDEGLILDIYEGGEASLEPAFSYTWFRADLESAEDGDENTPVAAVISSA